MVDGMGRADGKAPVRCAVATSDGFLVDQHFGRARRFEVYEVEQGSEPRFIESRKVQRACTGLGHDDDVLDAIVARLADCAFVVVARIGPGARVALARRGIKAYEIVAETEAAIEKAMVFRRVLAIADVFEEE